MKRPVALIAICAALVLASASCARYQESIQTEILPEQELYTLGMTKFNEKAWEDAIATFDRYERLYVTNDRVQEVRLKRADAQFFRNSTSSLILAKSEYQSFLALYPRYERDDYVWLQIARCSFNQMLPPNRDQTPTRNAIEDLLRFLERFPDSSLVPEARQLLQQAYANMAEYHIIVGEHYFKRQVFPSAAERFKAALELKVELSDLENVIYKLTLSLSRSSDYYRVLNEYSQGEGQENIRAHYRTLHDRYLYEAKQYLAEYSGKYPSNTARIAELQAEINMVLPIKDEPAKPEGEAPPPAADGAAR